MRKPNAGRSRPPSDPRGDRPSGWEDEGILDDVPPVRQGTEALDLGVRREGKVELAPDECAVSLPHWGIDIEDFHWRIGKHLIRSDMKERRRMVGVVESRNNKEKVQRYLFNCLLESE